MFVKTFEYNQGLKTTYFHGQLGSSFKAKAETTKYLYDSANNLTIKACTGTRKNALLVVSKQNF